jgi:heme A synthase
MATRLDPSRVSEETSRIFRSLSLVTVVAIFLLVTLGGVVRVTGSGLGCPDWPLCHGRLVPPLEVEAIIEYSHRLLASVVGLLVLSVAALASRLYAKRRWIFLPAVLGLVLVIVQAVVGGITVITELAAGLVSIHLALAETLLATMLMVLIVALRGDPTWSRGSVRVPALALGAALATFALLLVGSAVTVTGAATACGTAWPLCAGESLLPSATAPLVHMLHRAGALLAGLALLAALAAAWGWRRSRPEVAQAAAWAGALFLAQVLVGALGVGYGFPVAVKLLHLVVATGLWMAVAVLAMLTFTARHPDFQAPSRA